MAGFYNRTTEDGAYTKARDDLDNQQYDYTLYRGAVMRENLANGAPFLTPGSNIDFYKPMNFSNVTRDSFISGRGMTLSRNPDDEVIYLPVSLFNTPPVKQTCDRVDLQPMFTKTKPTCNGLRETEISQYAFSAGKYAGDYAGINSVVYSNLQSRVGADWAPDTFRECAQNYGSYQPTRSYAKYSP